jgi:hypothetical protein
MGEIKAIGARGCERGGCRRELVAARFCSGDVEVSGVLLWVLVAGWGF